MKMLEHVEEGLIRQRVDFILGCGTTDAIFIVRQLQEKHLIANKPLYIAFFYLEKKAFFVYIEISSGLQCPRLEQTSGLGVVSAPSPVHVKGCKKSSKSR